MRCASCQTVNPSGNRFCGQCGAAFSAHQAAQALPKWGELKQATVLFADIVGSTERVASLDPEQAMGQLRPAILRMCDSVERFGGTVVRTLGDGVMALFGVPRALEGHALLACEAALHMQNAFRTDPHGMAIRIGLHSGAVASDPHEADAGRGGGAHGVTIHLASRVVALATPGGIRITEACRALAGARCSVMDARTAELRGIGAHVTTYELGAISDVRGLAQREGMPQTRFLGRQQELAKLEERLAGLTERGGGTVGLRGEPGAGKSRLCHEFALRCEAQDVVVMRVRVQLFGHAMPLQPVLEFLRHHIFGIQQRDTDAVARDRVAQRVGPLNLTATDLALLNELLGIAEPEAAAMPIGPKARQERMKAVVTRLIRLEADVPRLILMEDLHWVDEASEEFVATMVDAVVGTRSLLLLNYRSSYAPPWGSLPHFEQIELAELGTTDMVSLIKALLAPDCNREDICRLLVERSGGNPFFAEELVSTLKESKVLTPWDGLPDGGLEAVAQALPVTVQAVVGARLDRLGEPEKTLLQMCAIIGKEIPMAVLEHVASPLAGQIERGLIGLCHAQVILPQAADGGRHFAFRHPLIQEVAYSAQLKVRRGHVHSSVAEAMEIYYQEHLDEYASLISYHYEQAGKSVQAAKHCARAASWVGSTSAAPAIKHWRKVRALLQGVQGSVEVDELRVTAGAKVALLGWREGLTFEEVKPLIDEAVSLASRRDDRAIPWLLSIEGRMLVASGGDADGYVKSARKALLYVDADKSPGRLATACAFLSQACNWAGLVKEALDANDIAMKHVADVDAFDQEFIGFSIAQWTLGMRGRLLARAGRLSAARECLEAMVAMEASSTEPPVHGMSHFGFVELGWCLNDPHLATEHAMALSRLADKHGGPYLQAFALGSRGCAAVLANKHEEAMICFSDALDLIRKSGAAMEYETEVLVGLAESHLLAGDPRHAHATASQAVGLSRLRSTRLAECRALAIRGAAAQELPGGVAATAEADFDAASKLITLTGAEGYRPWMARIMAPVMARAPGQPAG